MNIKIVKNPDGTARRRIRTSTGSCDACNEQRIENISTQEIMGKEKKYIDDLSLLDDPASQYDYLLDLGMRYQGDTTIRTDTWRVAGCKSALWFCTENHEHRLHLRGDSDSVLIRGMLHIFTDIYEGHSEKEIQEHPPEVMMYISDAVIYPEIKNNGLSKCYQLISHFDDKETAEGNVLGGKQQ